MAKTRHTQEQIDQVLLMLASGASVADIMEATGVPRSTIYFWKKSQQKPKIQDGLDVQDSPIEQSIGLELLDKFQNAVQDKLDIQDCTIRQLLDSLTTMQNELAELKRWKKVTIMALQPVLESRLETLDPKAVQRAQFLLDNFKEEPDAE